MSLKYFIFKNSSLTISTPLFFNKEYFKEVNDMCIGKKSTSQGSRIKYNIGTIN